MEQWVSASECFIEADVIRWNESVFQNRRRGKGKPLRIGERQVIAEVLRTDRDGWVFLLVRACTITADNFAGRNILPLKFEAQIKRAQKTILRGKPERLLWSDESARDVLLRHPPKA